MVLASASLGREVTRPIVPRPVPWAGGPGVAVRPLTRYAVSLTNAPGLRGATAEAVATCRSGGGFDYPFGRPPRRDVPRLVCWQGPPDFESGQAT